MSDQYPFSVVSLPVSSEAVSIFTKHCDITIRHAQIDQIDFHTLYPAEHAHVEGRSLVSVIWPPNLNYWEQAVRGCQNVLHEYHLLPAKVFRGEDIPERNKLEIIVPTGFKGELRIQTDSNVDIDEWDGKYVSLLLRDNACLNAERTIHAQTFVFDAVGGHQHFYSVHSDQCNCTLKNSALQLDELHTHDLNVVQTGRGEAKFYKASAARSMLQNFGIHNITAWGWLGEISGADFQHVFKVGAIDEGENLEYNFLPVYN